MKFQVLFAMVSLFLSSKRSLGTHATFSIPSRLGRHCSTRSDYVAPVLVAAADAVRGKRARCPPSGGELVPLVFEAGGRPADEIEAFVRSWGAGLDEVERSRVIRYA